MKKTLLVLAGLMAAGVAMAADGASITFKSYLSANNNLKVIKMDGSTVTSPDWYLALTDAATGNVLMGTKGTALGALSPVVGAFNGATGFVTAGGDWVIKDVTQGASASLKLCAFYSPTADWATGVMKSYSDAYTVALGGNELSPPVVPGKFDFGGAKTLTVVPEPSVLALGLLGLGAFLIRRRG